MPNYIAIFKAGNGGGLTQADITGVVQIVNFQTGEVNSGVGTIPSDDTKPQNTEGDEYMTLAITPKNANNKLYIDVTFIGENSVAGQAVFVALFQDAIANALASAGCQKPAANYNRTITFRHSMIAGTVVATTFKVRAGGHSTGTTTFNGFATGRLHGGAFASSITIMEVKV
jgi:hypothetical protein